MKQEVLERPQSVDGDRLARGSRKEAQHFEVSARYQFLPVSRCCSDRVKERETHSSQGRKVGDEVTYGRQRSHLDQAMLLHLVPILMYISDFAGFRVDLESQIPREHLTLQRPDDLFPDSRIDQIGAQYSHRPAERARKLAGGRADPIRGVGQGFEEEGEDGGRGW